MIVITGAVGFIGSCLLSELNKKDVNNIILVDDFSNPQKLKNIENKKYIYKINRNVFFDWLKTNHNQVGFIFHLGARTNTAEFDIDILNSLNLFYSQKVWKSCVEYNIPLIYASSAATYGDGELGYSDNHTIIPSLKPLNPYGVSKNEFDKWVLLQNEKPPLWIGLKFFNVFGPNEYHKNRMASVVYHAFNQIKQSGKMKIFRSHRPDFEDGKQLRDFIYVKDVVNVLIELFEKKSNLTSGIYNLGTGNARSFYDLVTAVFYALEKEPIIEFIDIPIDIRDKYQCYTQADMNKLNENINYSFGSLENSVKDYVSNYLDKGIFF